MNVDRTGVFRAEVVESGLSKAKKEGSHPRLEIKGAKLTAYYDQETGEWVDWSEYGQTADCYLYLFGMVGKIGNKKLSTTVSCDQVCKVFDWDGADLQELVESRPGLKFQLTIKDNDPEYADKTPFQVSWIDVFDADPTQGIAKLSKEEVKGLQAKYAALLKAKAKPAAPAKAPKKPAAKKVETPKKPESGVITKKPKAPPKVPAAAAPPPTTQVDNYTKQQAWETVVDLKMDNVTDEQLQVVWQKSIGDVSNGGGEDLLDGEGWWKVKDRTLDAVGKI